MIGMTISDAEAASQAMWPGTVHIIYNKSLPLLSSRATYAMPKGCVCMPAFLEWA